MDLAPVLARLKAQLVGFKAIGSSAELDAAMGGKAPTPGAFLLPLAESGDDVPLLGRTTQRLVLAFGVALVVKNQRDTQGAAALDDLAALRTQLKTALVGWVPDVATGEPVHFRAGRLLQMDGDGRLWWMDEFEFATYWSA